MGFPEVSDRHSFLNSKNYINRYNEFLLGKGESTEEIDINKK